MTLLRLPFSIGFASDFLPYLAAFALSRWLSQHILFSFTSISGMLEIPRNLANPNLRPLLFLFLATNTSTIFPTVLNCTQRSDSDQASGKLVKKNVVAFTPRESSCNGE
ncbi:hypothetical protein LXL04_027789 [Taraxacum kok-saghyz]